MMIGKKRIASCLPFLLIQFIPVFCYSGTSAVDSLKTVLVNAKEDTAKAGAWSKLAYELYILSKYTEARECVRKGIILAQKLNYTKQLAVLYRISGDIYRWNENDYDKAIEQYRRSLEIEKKDGRKNKEALCYDKIARAYIKSEQYLNAGASMQFGLAIYAEIQDTAEQIKMLTSLWELYNFRISDRTAAINYFNDAIKLASNSGKKENIAKLYNGLGDTYAKEGEYEKGIEYLNKSQYLYDEMKDQKGLASVYYDIGGLYENTGNYQRYLEYTHKILKIRIELGDTLEMANAYNNVGWAYQLLEDYKSALDYQLNALRLYESVGDEMGSAYPIGNLGIIYNKLGDYNKAIEYSSKARVLFEKANDDVGVAEAYNNMGNAYRSLKKYDKALEFLHKGLQITKLVSDGKYELKNSYEGLSATYKEVGDYKKAYEFHQLFFQLRDSLENQENAERINKIHTKVENEKKQKEIELLNKDVLLNAAEAKKQRIITYSAVGGIALLLVTFFIFLGYRQKQKAHKQLEKYNKEILLQKEQVEKSHQNTRLLSDIGRDITSSLSVEEITQKVYANINTLMDASVLAIGIYDPDKNVLNFPGDIEKGEKLPFTCEELTDENRSSVWCFTNQKEMIINVLKRDRDKYFPGKEAPAPIIGEQTESLIYLPLSTSNKKIGVMTVQSFKQNAYSEYQIDIIKNLAIYVTTALENARLYGNMEAEVKARTTEIEKQKEELAKLSIVASETDNAVVITDAECKIEWVNACFTRLTGYSLEDLPSNSLIEASSNPNIRQILQDAIKSSKPVVYDGASKTKDGHEIWFQTTLTPILGTDGKVKNLVAIDSDITELKRIETEIKKQNVIISEKNKHITDSINYAKLIQDAILPSEAQIKKVLPKSFVLFKPKDIVSGDFYWMIEKHGKIFFAVVDCTGHGVPGAFVSIIGYNGLHRSVNRFARTTPAEILDKLSELVEEMFGHGGAARIKDGMDIAICAFDPATNTLEFAGANNPIYIITESTHKTLVNSKSVILGKRALSEVKGNKQPIGAFDHRKKFTNHTFKLQEGDTIYIFSDGYADQFGGAMNKKFMYSQFKKTILALQEKPIDDHRDILNDQIEKWKADLEQVDDICVIGMRI